MDSVIFLCSSQLVVRLKSCMMLAVLQRKGSSGLLCKFVAYSCACTTLQIAEVRFHARAPIKFCRLFIESPVVGITYPPTHTWSLAAFVWKWRTSHLLLPLVHCWIAISYLSWSVAVQIQLPEIPYPFVLVSDSFGAFLHWAVRVLYGPNTHLEHYCTWLFVCCIVLRHMQLLASDYLAPWFSLLNTSKIS